MSRLNKNELSVTGLLRILFRWKNSGLLAFTALFVLTVMAALAQPLVYESQVILERKPAKVTPQLAKDQDDQFDVYRLTSESQRSVALLKSRYLMEKWLDTLGIKAKDSPARERELAKLSHSLVVQPVSYTDLFVLKVRAASPAEANRRAGVIATLFADWDMQQNRTDAKGLIEVLNSRVAQVNEELREMSNRLKSQKSTQALSLSGSSAARQLDVNLSAQGKLYELLTTELDQAERMLHNDQLPRTRVLTPPSTPDKPLMSRLVRLFLGLCGSLLFGLGFIFLLEWQDPTVRRIQDVAREIPAYPIITIPYFSNGHASEPYSPHLAGLSKTVGDYIRSKGSTLIQFISPSEGDGKTKISASLIQILGRDFKVCLLHQTASAALLTPGLPILPLADAPATRLTNANASKAIASPAPSTEPIRALDISPNESLSKYLAALKTAYQLIVIDTDSVPSGAPGANLVEEADLVCVLLSAGRTSRYFFRILSQQLQRYPRQKVVFLLNHYEDPLPLWLLPH